LDKKEISNKEFLFLSSLFVVKQKKKTHLKEHLKEHFYDFNQKIKAQKMKMN